MFTCIGWAQFRSTLLAFMERCDVILCPVNSTPSIDYNLRENSQAPFTYTMTHNLTGFPAAVVRCGTSPEGMPIGVQIVARPWREDVALAVAQHLETVFGGWQRPPL